MPKSGAPPKKPFGHPPHSGQPIIDIGGDFTFPNDIDPDAAVPPTDPLPSRKVEFDSYMARARAEALLRIEEERAEADRNEAIQRDLDEKAARAERAREEAYTWGGRVTRDDRRVAAACITGLALFILIDSDRSVASNLGVTLWSSNFSRLNESGKIPAYLCQGHLAAFGLCIVAAITLYSVRGAIDSLSKTLITNGVVGILGYLVILLVAAWIAIGGASLVAEVLWAEPFRDRRCAACCGANGWDNGEEESDWQCTCTADPAKHRVPTWSTIDAIDRCGTPWWGEGHRR